MRSHNLSNILRFDFAIPDILRINDHYRSVIAEAEATTSCHLHFIVETVRPQILLLGP